jgi:hypothetical protein
MKDVQINWYAPLRALRSLGSQKEKISHMGELAEARKKHLGQFFTPDAVAAFMWRLVENLPVRNLFDNSIGSGRLLQYANPEDHRIYGVDVHKETVDVVKDVFETVGFDVEIIDTGMENIRPINMCCSLINPPFSIHLESHGLLPIEGFTRMGRFGPDTSAISDEYAVAQALECSSIVIALVPKSSADAMRRREGCWSERKVVHRLCAVFDLPDDSFEEEGTKVSTSVAVFGEYLTRKSIVHLKLDNLNQEIPNLNLKQALSSYRGKPELKFQHLDCLEPTITLPVTGDNRVRISLDGRKIKLKYACGFTQARVENAILMKRISSTEHVRLPRGVKYAGQGKLDLEVYLIQEDPIEAFNHFLDLIKCAEATPVVDGGVMPTLLRKVRKSLRSSTPLRHTVWSRGASNAETITGAARKSHNVDPSKWISPVIKEGEEVTFKKLLSGRFEFSKKDQKYEINADDLESRFNLLGASEGWQTVHTGLQVAFPHQANLLKNRLDRLGIRDWLTWDFQSEDCIELTMKPKGAVAAWKQACGKSRLAAALVLMSEMKHGLIIVESRLVGEMLGQLLKINIPASEINVINKPDDLTTLKQFNIISYERARSIVDRSVSKNMTYARRLRRRIGILIADEGERLANMESAQSQALFNISAKKCYILTGTPIANYPRDIHGVVAFVAGDGTASQPYGFRRGYLERNWINSMEFACRGIQQLSNDFVTLEWVTWEFAETLREGAKREIPKIANVEKFRSWLSPIIKRRLTEEPEVEKFIHLKKPYFETHDVQWDPAHLSFYLEVADDFAEIFKKEKDGGRNNLAVLLAKLQAVQIALNAPQMGVKGFPCFAGLTSKQRAVRDYLAEKVAEGKKVLMYAENPSVIELMARELDKLGIDSVKFHGGIPIQKRIKDKDDRFVNGNTPVMLLTKGSGKAGYNLPMANEVVFYDRSWSAKTESQAMARPIRTENKFSVKGNFFHLPGSLDEYQSQMVAFKSDAANAGLDWATPELDETEFLHLTYILEKFVKELADLHGINSNKMRTHLKNSGVYATV